MAGGLGSKPPPTLGVKKFSLFLKWRCISEQPSLNRGMQKKKTTITALPLTYSSFATKTNWTKLPPFGRGKKKWKKLEFYSWNKDRHSRQVPYCNVYFIALLVFLVLQISVWFQFLNWTFWRSCTIDSVTIMYQASLVKKSWIHPFFQKGDLCHWKVFNWSLKQIAYKQIRFQLNSSVWPSFTKYGY